jgi:hypothetical protein
MSSVKWKISARIVAKTETYGAENTHEGLRVRRSS